MVKSRHILLFLLLISMSSCVGLFQANSDRITAMIFLSPFVLAIVYTFQYYINYNKARFGKQSFSWKKFRSWIIIGVVVPVFILLVNCLPEKFFEKPETKAAYAQLIDDNSLLFEAYRESVLKYPDSIDCHVRYVELSGDQNSVFSREFESLEELYLVKSRSKHRESAAIGQLISGIILKRKRLKEEALDKLIPLSENNFRFANYYVANILMSKGLDSLACIRLENEISSGGNLIQAFPDLASYYFNANKVGELNHLLSKDPSLKYVPHYLAEEHYFKDGNWNGYLKALFRRLLNPLNWSGFLAALCIAAVWFWYVRSIDVFRPESWLLMLATFLCGACSPFFVFLVSSYSQYELGFEMNGGFWNAFAYSVVGIGMVEELAKIIPLLLILWLTKAVKEPYDYLLYASLAALGFAFSENLIYFQASKLEIIHGRGFVSVVGHMCWSSTIAYGFVLIKYRYKKWNPLITFLVFWVIAALVHGLFDLWLIGPVKVWLLSILIFLIGTQIWWTMQNNCLNNSPDFNYKDLSRFDNIQFVLVVSLTGIFLLQYVLIGVQMGPATANYALFSSFLQGGYFIIFLTTSIGRFDIFPGYWEPVKVPYNLTDILIPKLSNQELYVGKRVEVWAEAQNNRMRPFLPRKGQIVARRAIGIDKRWYLVKLEHHLGISNYVNDYILVQFVYDDASLEKEEFCEVELRLLNRRHLVEHLKGKKQNISRAGNGMLKKI